MPQPGSPAASMPPDESHIMRRLAELERELRELRAADIFRSAGMQAQPGLVASTDYNGTADNALGSSGWMLGSHAGGPSLLALNGVNVYQSLSGAIASLQAQANYQASLISRDTSVLPYNTGTLVNDATWRLVGPQAVVTLAVPTGKMRVTISSSEVSVSPGTNSVVGAICYGVDGVEPLLPDARYARIYSAGTIIGTSLVRIGTVTVPPGTHTVRAQGSYWSAGASAASIQFSTTRLLVEAIGND